MYTNIVIKACFGDNKKATKLTTKVCKTIGDKENGNGITIYAETQFIAINNANLVNSNVLLE
ncbi:hypothetical protein Mfun01_11420 [Megamonas funiformis]|nr:hypothetical protein Mfun01_11420 [Megamonas funiformis]CBL06523.1 hypothetical protein MHY_17470 [Megamonas hypermegale ART12/1]